MDLKQWKSDLRKAVVAMLECNAKHGIEAMSADNVWQCVHCPPNGPIGSNASYTARKIFDEVVEDLPANLRSKILAIT